MQSKLEALLTVTDSSVNYAGTRTNSVVVTFLEGTKACEDTIMSIEFTQEPDDLPPLTAATTGTLTDGDLDIYTDGDSVTTDDGTYTSQEGTKENAVCSNRGLCQPSSGECLCFEGFGSSDGNNNEGTRRDCGYILPFITAGG